ncbi:hypothetical protein M422DRAFT_266489 [Sphaerobolus stellatus SS14]|uniref:Uncharacterized protein n=1 Tax=Sphaerobolus stellatus (strain SS14) TaxID=990650 RepID=A0A0C9V2J7_SPHS4|nr:hypothetical protein M422DRAFT_266489 [Sphaerobolus stellatus SS14]
MALSFEQLDTLKTVQNTLESAGIFSESIRFSNPAISDLRDSLSSTLGGAEHHPLISLIKYSAPFSRDFSPEEIHNGCNKSTRKSYVSSIIHHPQGAVVEYPETGSAIGKAAIIQYSLGEPKGSKKDVECFLLRSSGSGLPGVQCTQVKLACTGFKRCNFNTSLSAPSLSDETPGAWQEVFQKTLALICAVQDSGCPFSSESIDGEIDGSSFDKDEDESDISNVPTASTLYEILRDNRAGEKESSQCTGPHNLINLLGEIDTVYLEALFHDDLPTILQFEQRAQVAGFGPLVPCTALFSAREQKMLCPNFHRTQEGKLTRGTIRHISDCPARFEFYYPNDPTDCPYVAVVCRNPHSHPNPTPTRTPRIIKELIEEFLLKLGWRLADATPRRLHTESSFLSDLHRLLGWSKARDPTLSDLHPSLGNMHHTGRIIQEVRSRVYPYGTGFEAAGNICKEHAILNNEFTYVRCVETHDLKGHAAFRLIVCMFPAMSALLLSTKCISIDTSFKRVHQWQEFEIEAWFSQYDRSIVFARALMNSQSAEAHLILFQRIFGIAEKDTGRELRMRHIHGDELDTVTADGHRGQAIGNWGRLCQSKCQSMAGYCAYEPTKALHALTPTDHLKRCYHYCFSHHTRHVRALRGQVEENVRTSMMALASAEELPAPIYDLVISTILSGGKKAVDWLKDKEAADGWALAAIYRPKSKIPLDVWKAAPSTSNGNEQAHRNINRDGTKLSVLAVIQFGQGVDFCQLESIDTFILHGVRHHDQAQTHFRRVGHALIRSAAVQLRTVQDNDSELEKSYIQLSKWQEDTQKQTVALKRALENGEV